MSKIASDFKEERACVAATAALLHHVTSCAECIKGASIKSASSSVIDISDPDMVLCGGVGGGQALRLAAGIARSMMPAERLISFYGLEMVDGEDAVSPADAHDCAKAMDWLRNDPGTARSILVLLEDRAGPLEDRKDTVPERRLAFLIGYRKRFPSRGAIPTAEKRAAKAEAADRINALCCDRYERRHGAPPLAKARDEFRKSLDLWIDESGELGKMADDAEKFRDAYPKRWAAKALLKPKDPLAELRKIARWIADGLIQNEIEKG